MSELSEKMGEFINLIKLNYKGSINSIKISIFLNSGENQKFQKWISVDHPKINFEFTSTVKPQKNSPVERAFFDSYWRMRATLNKTKFTLR